MDTYRYNIKKKIIKILNNVTKYIIKGYIIIDREQDGCDEYGYKYWVVCKNGSSCRDWEVSTLLEKSLLKYYLKKSIEGIFIEDTIYYLDPIELMNFNNKKSIKIIDYDTSKRYIDIYNNNFRLLSEFESILLKLSKINTEYYKYQSFRMDRNIIIEISEIETTLLIKKFSTKLNKEYIKKNYPKLEKEINDLYKKYEL